MQIYEQFPATTQLPPSQDFLRAYRTDLTLIRASVVGSEVYPHTSPFSIKTAFRGVETYISGKRDFVVRPGSVLITPAQTIYGSRCLSGVITDSLSVHFPQGLVSDAFALRSRGYAVALDGHDLDPDFSDVPLHSHSPSVDFSACLLRLNTLDPEQAGAALEAASLDALDHAITYMASARHAIDALPAARPAVRRELFRRVQLARAAMDEDPGAPWTLAQLGRVACLSPYHLHRSFRAVTGIAPMSYLRQRRVDTAARLLRTTELPVAVIAGRAGFENFSAFSRSFRVAMAATPTAYRSQIA